MMTVQRRETKGLKKLTQHSYQHVDKKQKTERMRDIFI
jgi:hypothetical protein